MDQLPYYLILLLSVDGIIEVEQCDKPRTKMMFAVILMACAINKDISYLPAVRARISCSSFMDFLFFSWRLLAWVICCFFACHPLAYLLINRGNLREGLGRVVSGPTTHSLMGFVLWKALCLPMYADALLRAGLTADCLPTFPALTFNRAICGCRSFEEWVHRAR